MTDSELKALLSAEKADALSAMQADKLSAERADAMNYYLGDMRKDMPASEGRSRAVSTDVADTVEGLMPGLMDIFCSSDEVVQFEPVGAEDEEAAQQETDYVNHVFMQQNPGFMILYAFVKDALLQKTGLVKIWWEKHQEEERETYLDLTEDQFAILAQEVLQSNGGLAIIAHTAKEDQADPASGQPLVVHDVEILRTRDNSQAKAEAVPPEEFGIERNARTLRDCNYCFHRLKRTESQLIAQGFDAKQIKELSAKTGLETSEDIARDTVNESQWSGSDVNRAARPIEVVEHYIRMDYTGDGKPRLYKVTTAQGEVLRRDGKPDVEELDIIPFAAVTPVPVTHRFFGQSIADLVMDIQRIKTALLRGMLDNLYLHNSPRVEVAETYANSNTLDDLLVSRPGGVVRTKTPGGLNWQVVPDITGSVYPALAYMDTTREMRTGVTRQGQGLDANALQNQSATAVNQVFTASVARMKLIARIIAETGVKDLFSLLHQVIRKHGQQAQTVRLRNKWVTVDPRNWKTRNDMTINVGLGTGGKTERVAHVMALIGLQKEAMQSGKTNLVDDTKLFNSAAELTKLMDYKNPDRFFNDPGATNSDGTPKYPPPQPQPDPKVMQIQMQAQLDEKSDQRKAEIERIQAEADVATQDRKTQAETEQSEREFALKRELAVLQAQLEQEKFLREEARKDREHQQKMDLARETHQHSVRQAELGMIATAQAADIKAEQAKRPRKSKEKAGD